MGKEADGGVLKVLGDPSHNALTKAIDISNPTQGALQVVVPKVGANFFTNAAPGILSADKTIPSLFGGGNIAGIFGGKKGRGA